MKFAVAAVTLAALASAQSLGDIPQCAVKCIDDARASSTDCTATDYVCICKNKDTLTTAASSCVIGACGLDVATNQVLPAVNKFCDSVGSGSSSSSAAASSTSDTASSTVASSTSAVETSTTTGEAETSTSVPSPTSVASISSPISNGTISSTGGVIPTSANPTPVPTAGAATVAGSLVILALGFVITL
ncbi:hypothetical protein GGS26DRAFT_245866 [Hypomontagnella submonticulosa]|nr:hypothetical protein GGS26DRAFT_245866 [Hypomontagnella submonticulosa]